jgi:hypothetical protein
VGYIGLFSVHAYLYSNLKVYLSLSFRGTVYCIPQSGKKLPRGFFLFGLITLHKGPPTGHQCTSYVSKLHILQEYRTMHILLKYVAFITGVSGAYLRTANILKMKMNFRVFVRLSFQHFSSNIK